ncbi:bifunctional nuclease family protein [Methanocrinis sp.]|uniref:bifunctional nuclease family protein n=1 Tax=Methanocrinis sp. TaxID=3101522 RepID=UPI003D0F1948
MEEPSPPLKVKVKGVYAVHAGGDMVAPVVLLEDETSRIVPVFVGLSEAISIYQALSGTVSPRPTTHDLFVSTLDNLGASITGVLIDDLDGGVYYARLSVSIDSVEREVDARPSDCMALALRSGAPITIQERVVIESSMNGKDLDDLKGIENFL